MGELRDLVRVGLYTLREDGIRDFAIRSGYTFYRMGLQKYFTATRKAYRGESVYDREWDALIVLDGCRTDLLAEVEEDYDFLEGAKSREFTSLGSASDEWMNRNFPEEKYLEEQEETVMVTGNPFSRSCLKEDNFEHLEESWRYAWDEVTGAVLPGPITDAAIHCAREYSPERLIVHYMQPHYPFLEHPDMGDGVSPASTGRITNKKQPWDELLLGEISREEIWEAYRDNLDIVMDEVRLLVNNIDADPAVITADHGNSLGRWNWEELGIYGHRENVATPSLRRVPWVELEAVDSGTHEPSKPEEIGVDSGGRVEVLRSLGYI